MPLKEAIAINPTTEISRAVADAKEFVVTTGDKAESVAARCSGPGPTPCTGPCRPPVPGQCVQRCRVTTPQDRK